MQDPGTAFHISAAAMASINAALHRFALRASIPRNQIRTLSSSAATNAASVIEESENAHGITPESHSKSTFDLVAARTARSTLAARHPISVRDVEVSDADVAEFEAKGYFMPEEPMLDKESCAQLREDYARLFDGFCDTDATPPEFEFWAQTVSEHAEGGPGVRKVNNAFWINAGQRELVASEAIGRVAGRLLRSSEIRLWHDQAIWKPPEGESPSAAGNIGWHQDYGFWRASSSPEMVTAFVALQDITIENGGLRTIEGSHRWGLVEGSNTFFETDLDAQKRAFSALAPEGAEWRDTPTLMRAGQVAFHHSLTFHGSGPNGTALPRLAAAVHMQGDAVRYRCGFWHPNVRELGPNARDGDMFDGPCFPLMWRDA
jgi:ectoine hydroxylase-related dioxygenase (phytanoyl-CoA dioxygenase family)